MSHKKPLEQPIFNSIIHYAYMLHDDEREVLLRAFLEMSYKIHREAVEIMSPEEDIGCIIAAYTQFEESPVIESSRDAAAAEAPRVAAKVPANHESVIAKHLQSFRHMFRRRESVLQEEEELALFSTIEGVANQVNREAFESEMRRICSGKERSATAYEQAAVGPWGAMGVPVGEIIAGGDGGKEKARLRGRPRDTYIEFMDEELMHMRGIIDRNRALRKCT
jgi:hypothetical protein